MHLPYLLHTDTRVVLFWSEDHKKNLDKGKNTTLDKEILAFKCRQKFI